MIAETGLPLLRDSPVASSQVAGQKSKLPHFSELDGLRGIAAVVVFVHHFLQVAATQPTGGWNWFFRLILHLSKYGSSGVDVFFVLSGYLITSLLLIDRGKPNYFHNFYWKRALRILPVYFVHLILTQSIIGNAWGYIWLSLIFLVNFSQRFHVTTIGVAWTLSIEEQFYLIWPNFVRRLRLTSLYYLAFALVLTSVLLRIVMPLATGGMAIIYTPYRCDGLGLGAILALQWFEPEGRPQLIQTLLNILHSNLLLVLAIISAAVLLCLAAEPPLIAGASISTVNYLAYRLIRRIIRPGEPNRALTWLGHGVPVYFGKISYSLYLYHVIVLFLVTKHFGQIDSSHLGQATALFALAFGATIVMSTVSLYAMELPIQSLRRFVLK
jgi:peptidoglycan/LPS O-acetylase OafA/YrhL